MFSKFCCDFSASLFPLFPLTTKIQQDISKPLLTLKDCFPQACFHSISLITWMRLNLIVESHFLISCSRTLILPIHHQIHMLHKLTRTTIRPKKLTPFYQKQKKFYEILMSNLLAPSFKISTRINGKVNTLIDNIFSISIQSE